MVEEDVILWGSERDGNEEGWMMSDETNLLTKDMIAAAGFNVKSPIVNAIIQNLIKVPSKKPEQKPEQNLEQKTEQRMEQKMEQKTEQKADEKMEQKTEQKMEQKVEQTEQKTEQIAEEKTEQKGDEKTEQKAEEKMEQNTENSEKNCCLLCNIPCMNSESDRVSHILGKRHSNKVWSLEIDRKLERIYKKKACKEPVKKEYMCQQCNVTANSPIQFVDHMKSKKHIRVKSSSGIILSASAIKECSNPTLTYYCQYCISHFDSKRKMLKHKASLVHQMNWGKTKKP